MVVYVGRRESKWKPEGLPFEMKEAAIVSEPKDPKAKMTLGRHFGGFRGSRFVGLPDSHLKHHRPLGSETSETAHVSFFFFFACLDFFWF